MCDDVNGRTPAQSVLWGGMFASAGLQREHRSIAVHSFLQIKQQNNATVKKMKFRSTVPLLATTMLLSPSSVHAFIVSPLVPRYASMLSSRTSMSTLGATNKSKQLPIMAEEEVMSQKAHGTSEKPVMKNLRWGCDYQTADRICNFNRHYAEYAGYWQTTNFLNDEQVKNNEPIHFYDSVTGELLFTAPVGRTMEEFLLESQSHGWPSFRDEEVNWEFVRCLTNGECISTTGTHLGHNLPDSKGNRYCINLVSVAGQPKE